MQYGTGKNAFYCGLSTCCWATDKGAESGVVCRKCFHDLEGTANVFDESEIEAHVARDQ